MEKRLDIVCWAFTSWEGDYMKSTVQLMKELAVNHNVLYIDYSYTIKDVLKSSIKNSNIPTKRILRKRNSIKLYKLENGANIHVLSLPPIIPYNWTCNQTIFNSIQFLNNSLIRKRVLYALKKLNIQSPILINAFNPVFGLGIKSWFPYKAMIYYCYDEIAHAPWIAKYGAALEAKLIKQSDGLIFSSEALKQKKGLNYIPSYVVNNGVDLTLFQTEMNSINSPTTSTEKRIVYCGSIDSRLDFDLLIKLVKRFSNYSFHFIGRIVEGSDIPLRQYKNVHFYGSVELEKLPAMIKSMDAGIIPFIKNEFTRYIYPMKMNEYLAMGLPVVMTDFAAIGDIEHLISVADDVVSFENALEKVVTNDTIQDRKLRSKIGQSNSWKIKAEELEEILLKHA